MRSYLILGMCTLFLVQYFVQLEWLQFVVVLLSLTAFLVSAVYADRVPRLLGILMMGVGIIIELNKGKGLGGISEGTLFGPVITVPQVIPHAR